MLDFILGYIKSRLSAQRRISKHPKSAGCAGHTVFAKHVCVVFYSAVGSSEMLHKLQKPFCDIRFFGLLAAARPFSDSVRLHRETRAGFHLPVAIGDRLECPGQGCAVDEF